MLAAEDSTLYLFTSRDGGHRPLPTAGFQSQWVIHQCFLAIYISKCK